MLTTAKKKKCTRLTRCESNLTLELRKQGEGSSRICILSQTGDALGLIPMLLTSMLETMKAAGGLPGELSHVYTVCYNTAKIRFIKEM